MIYFILLILVLFISLFVLYILTRQDFVLLRQNISLAQIFDLAAISFLAAFLVGRLFFILDNFMFGLFNVLRFFHLIRFPGISTIGFFIGGAVSIYFLFGKKKGMGRIYDIFAISFFPLYSFFLISQKIVLKTIYFPIILSVILIFIFGFFVRSHNKYILKDGSISLLFLLIISLISFIFEIFDKTKHVLFLNFTLMQIITLPVFLFSIVLFVINQQRSR